MAKPRPALLAGTLALALTFLLWLGGSLTWPELFGLDLRYQVRGAQDPGTAIVLVPISARMFDLGILAWPLKRDIYTHALANLRRAGARAVGLDVLLESRSSDDPDLAAELRRWQGRAVLAYRQASSPGGTYRGDTPIDTRRTGPASARGAFILPGGGVLAPRWPRGLGNVEVTQDLDGVIHNLMPNRRIDGMVVDSFPLALVRAVDPAVATHSAPDTATIIDYAGPAGTFSAGRELDLDLVAAGLFDPHAVAGKIVLVGSTDPAKKDLFPGPFDRGAALTPGVEVNANALRTLLLNRPLRRVPAPLDAAALLGLGALGLAAGLRLRPAWAAVATLLALVIYTTLDQGLFAARYWLNLVGPLLALSLVYVAVQATRVAESLHELRRVEAIFGRYVPPAVVRQLLGKREALRLGGQRRAISVLFSDIRGFTTLSEHLPPEVVGTMLNEYFSAMVEVIFAHGGTVDKFVGDAIMAVFNAPLDQPDHAERAAATALAMQKEADRLSAAWRTRGRPPLQIGVGVHTGDAVVGSFGAERRSEYTAIGDTVNVASRLEGLSKELGCSIVISAVTAILLPRPAPFEPLGPVAIRGREEEIEVYGVRRRANDLTQSSHR